MNLYLLALFAHVLGSIGIFAGMGVWLFGVWALRQVERVEAVRLLTRLITTSGNLVVGAILVLGVAGFYMAITTWGIQATWIIVATVNFVLLAPVGLLIIDPRVKAIAKAAHDLPNGPMPEALTSRTRDPLLATTLNVYIASLLGIVFMMTNKPTLAAAVVAALVAAALGLLGSVPILAAAAKRHAGSRRSPERVG